MRIIDEMGYTHEWNGGHHWNISDGNGEAFHAWTFGWEINRPTQVEALEAFIKHDELLAQEAREAMI